MSLRQSFSTPFRLVLVGTLLSSIGSGMTMSLLIVYLSSVRGFPTVVAGLVLSWMAVVGLVLGPAGGWCIDRYGARAVLFVGLLLQALGAALLAWVTTIPLAFAVASINAVGGAVLWASQNALIAVLVSEEFRQRMYGLQFMLLNLGLGIGALIGSSIVNLDDPSTFVVLYLVDAATYIAFAVILLFVHVTARAEPLSAEESDQGYRQVLADRRLRRFATAMVILVTFGYGSIDGGLPAFMTEVAGLPVRAVGLVFALNTAVIVIVQWWSLRFAENRSRSLLMGVVGALWALSWLLMGGSAWLAGAMSIAALALGMTVFAFAETLWSPVGPALLNHLAPDHLRGRYNAVGAWAWSVGTVLGPGVAGWLIGAQLGGVWVALLVVGSLAGAVTSLSLRRLLTRSEDGLPEVAPSMGGSMT